MALTTAARVVRRRPAVKAVRRFVLTRRVVQGASVALLVFMPLLGVFRVDLEGQYVVFLWQRLPIVWLAAILPPLILLPLGTFFALSLRFGRLFCSWACPQGALNEAATKSHLALWGRHKLWQTRRDLRAPKASRRRQVWWLRTGTPRRGAVAVYSARTLLLPPLAAFGVVSYVVDPAHLWNLLAGGHWTDPALLAFVAAAGIFYADLILLQELACRVCFFGYLQSVASYSRPTGVRRNTEQKANCHGCSACRDSCFAGVDPRRRAWEWARSNDLTFDDCVSCGDCLAACDDVTSRRGVPLIMEMPAAGIGGEGRGTS